MKGANFDNHSTFSFLLQDKKPISPTPSLRLQHSQVSSLFSNIFSKGCSPLRREQSVERHFEGARSRRSLCRPETRGSRDNFGQDSEFISRSKQILRQFYAQKQNISTQGDIVCENHPRVVATHTIQLSQEQVWLCEVCAQNTARQGIDIKLTPGCSKRRAGLQSSRRELDSSLQALTAARQMSLRRLEEHREFLMSLMEDWVSRTRSQIIAKYQAQIVRVKVRLESIERPRLRTLSSEERISVAEYSFREFEGTVAAIGRLLERGGEDKGGPGARPEVGREERGEEWSQAEESRTETSVQNPLDWQQ